MDLDLPGETRALQLAARDFARHELLPAERELDAVTDPGSAYTSDTYRRVMALAHELGLHKMAISEPAGGLGRDTLCVVVVLEELAAAGAGLASRLLVAPVPALAIDRFGLAERHPTYKEYLEEFTADTTGTRGGAWAITEPDVGSDIFTFHDPSIHFATGAVRAERGAGGYRISGAKSAFVSNGYLADCFLLMAAVDSTVGMEGTGIFLVPADTPTITRGKPLDKIGLRALNQAEVFFDGTEVPEEFLVFQPGPGYEAVLDWIVTQGNTHVAALALGVARAAYEHAFAYAHERVQGGRAIAEHQLVAMKLFQAYRSIEAARGLVWRSAWLIDQGRPDRQVTFAARTLACQACLQVTNHAMEILGGYGISRENPVEKLTRDARPLQVMDGTIDRVSLLAAAHLAV
jgi:alkylation response protein AidB-like acyl-CoA dehydrogenase